MLLVAKFQNVCNSVTYILDHVSQTTEMNLSTILNYSLSCKKMLQCDIILNLSTRICSVVSDKLHCPSWDICV